MGRRTSPILSITTIVASVCTFWLSAPVQALSLYHLIGYNFPKDESYIDTYQDKDILWNPNSGFHLAVGAYQRYPKNFELRMEASGVFGYYRYKTTDGRKVNTEAQAEATPVTTNTEWSRIFSIVPFIGSYYTFGKMDISFGVGVGPYFARSYESWEFKNINGQKAYLEIKKYYPVRLGYVGRVGVSYKVSPTVRLMLETRFEAINFVMTQVDLTSYTLDGKEHIDEYNRKQTTYRYALDVPDENKGGEALLAGFNFANYPQSKIGTSLSLRFGASYGF